MMTTDYEYMLRSKTNHKKNCVNNTEKEIERERERERGKRDGLCLGLNDKKALKTCVDGNIPFFQTPQLGEKRKTKDT